LRDQAARVLATMGEPVLEPLIEFLGSGLWYTRASAVAALGRMGNPRAAAPLVGMLNDPNRTVRDAVWDSLVLLCRNELATRELAAAFESLPEKARRFALDGLVERDSEAAGQVMRHMDGAATIAQRTAADAAEADLAWKDVVGGEGEAKQAVR
jgi:HEAT repeat protein